MPNKVLFDFDETLVSVNTFPAWVRFLLVRTFFSFRMCGFFFLAFLIFRRKFIRNLEHDEFKARLLTLEVPVIWYDIFAKKVARHVRGWLVGYLVMHLNNGDHVIVSSAAPCSYLVPCIKEILSAEVERITIVGASLRCGVLYSNHLSKKLEGLYAHGFLNRNESLYCVYTDSWDDFYVASIAKKVFLVCPSLENIEKYMNSPEFFDKTSVLNG